MASFSAQSSGGSTKSGQAHSGSGPLPYGFLRVASGEIAINPDEAKVVRLIMNARADNIPYRKISDRLNRAGYRTAKGTRWTPGSVETISRHEALYWTGIKHWGKVEAYQKWPIIMEEAAK